jgi:hypothetical protein
MTNFDPVFLSRIQFAWVSKWRSLGNRPPDDPDFKRYVGTVIAPFFGIIASP